MARSNSRGRNYVPFKWTKELIIFLSILAVAIILTIVCLIPTSKEKFMTEWSDAITAASGTALDDDHVFEYISLSKFETKKSEATKDEPLIILYGSSTDSTTVSNISSINKKAQDYGIDKIYILKSDFVMNADETDSKDKAKLRKLYLVRIRRHHQLIMMILKHIANYSYILVLMSMILIHKHLLMIKIT